MLHTPGIGHNAPPLSIDDLLHSEGAPSDAAVLEALVRRWEAANPELPRLAEKARKLADNKDRLPQQLDENTIEIALDLLAAIDNHNDETSPLANGLPIEMKKAAKTVDTQTKSTTNGLAALEKALRCLITDWLARDLAARNAAALPGAEKATSNVRLGRAGARAAITLANDISVADASKIPAKYLIPDLSAIGKAVAEGQVIPGVTVSPIASLRITWPNKIERKSET